MKPVHNYVSKILHEATSSSYDIITYIDIESCLTKEFIDSVMKRVIHNNPVLHHHIVKKDDEYFLKDDSSFDSTSYYDIHDGSFHDSVLTTYLNTPLTTTCKWKALFVRDETAQKTRLYFLIDHAYADGYQVIRILTSAFKMEDVTSKFKRSTSFYDTIYYMVFGTLFLVSLHLSFLYRVISNRAKRVEESQETELLICPPLSLSKIKQSTSTYNCTLNDFLYSIMIKTDFLYHNKKRTLYSASPINVSQLEDLNNVTPLFLRMENDYDNKTLLKKVHEMFNCCKYSFFIPLLSTLIQWVTPYCSVPFLTSCYDAVIHNCDYVYSNIIGPECSNLEITISDIHFATTAKDNEIVYNIISYQDNINIICSFKKGRIQDTKRFETCIMNAYEDLLDR